MNKTWTTIELKQSINQKQLLYQKFILTESSGHML